MMGCSALWEYIECTRHASHHASVSCASSRLQSDTIRRFHDCTNDFHNLRTSALVESTAQTNKRETRQR